MRQREVIKIVTESIRGNSACSGIGRSRLAAILRNKYNVKMALISCVFAVILFTSLNIAASNLFFGSATVLFISF
jgi:hypothetical protein